MPEQRACQCRLVEEVEAGAAEAADNVRFLAPLRRQLERLSGSDDFATLPDVFKARAALQGALLKALLK